jgi:hypothetical protein
LLGRAERAVAVVVVAPAVGVAVGVATVTAVPAVEGELGVVEELLAEVALGDRARSPAEGDCGDDAEVGGVDDGDRVVGGVGDVEPGAVDR